MFDVIFFFGRLYVYCGSSDIFLFFNDKKWLILNLEENLNEIV